MEREGRTRNLPLQGAWIFILEMMSNHRSLGTGKWSDWRFRMTFGTRADDESMGQRGDICAVDCARTHSDGRVHAWHGETWDPYEQCGQTAQEISGDMCQGADEREGRYLNWLVWNVCETSKVKYQVAQMAQAQRAKLESSVSSWCYLIRGNWRNHQREGVERIEKRIKEEETRS